MRAGKVGSVGLCVVVLSLALLGCAGASPSHLIGSAPVPSQPRVVAEPPLAAAYMAAFAHGDEVRAEQVASPLYRAEWTRRGLSPRDRQALLPASALAPASGEWLHFTYVGGAVDGHGFGHLLYVAYPVAGSGAAPPRVWRIDTAPDGRVIWAELVYLFSAETTATAPVLGGDNAVRPPLPEALVKLQTHLVAGVRSLSGPEGYYSAVLPTVAAEAHPAASGEAVVFFAIDPNGDVRPGAWSYGQANPGPSEYGQTPTPRTVSLAPELTALQRSYVESLCAGC